MKDAIKPIFSVKEKPIPKFSVGKTEKRVYEQGITYNEPGITYNEPGIAYGGIYGYDFVPMITQAKDIKPQNIIGGDFAGTQAQHGTIILEQGMLIGMLGMTYAQSGTIIF